MAAFTYNGGAYLYLKDVQGNIVGISLCASGAKIIDYYAETNN